MLFASSNPAISSSQAAHRLRRLFLLRIKSHLALVPLLLLSKSKPHFPPRASSTTSALRCAGFDFAEGAEPPFSPQGTAPPTSREVFVDCGGDAFTLQRLMGHSTLNMTKHYCSIYDADIAKNYDRVSPLAQIQKPRETIKM